MRQLRVETGVGSKNLRFRTGIYIISCIAVPRFPDVLHTIVLYGVIIIIHLPLEKPTEEPSIAVGEVCAFYALNSPPCKQAGTLVGTGVILKFYY